VPTYEYRCDSCSHQFERFQRMSDDPVKECEACGGEVQRLLFPVAIHFKGSGFYTTDYAKKKSLKGGPSEGNGSGSNGSSGEKASSDKSASGEKASGADKSSESSAESKKVGTDKK